MKKFLKKISFSFILFTIFTLSSAKNKQACKSDNECIEYNNCDISHSFCVHKKFYPFNLTEIIGLILIFLSSALSNAGGVGGGGLVIPILLLMLKFYTHEAIPISKLTIFTGALTSFILGFGNLHPFRKAITIDYNIPYLIVPMLLFGTMVGISLNKVMPPWIILICLTLVLLINTYKTLSRAGILRKKENEEHVKQEVKINAELKNIGYGKQLDDDSGSVSSAETDKNSNNIKTNSEAYKYGKLELGESINHGNNINFPNDLKINDLTSAESDNSQFLVEEEKKDLRRIPLEKFCIMAISYIYMLIISFLKGSDHFNSIINVQICSMQYWGIYLLYVPYAIITTYFISRKIRKEYDYRVSIGYKYYEQDIKWNINICSKFPIYGFLSGMLAGLLGIGGGTILGPLLLEIGLHPVVSTSTSNFLVLFTSSSTSIQFILLGMMNVDYGTACTIASTIGSFMGTILIQRIIQKTKKNSYLIYCLGIGLGLSALLIPFQTLMDIMKDIENKKNIWVFNTPC